MQNALPDGLFEGEPDAVIKRLDALLTFNQTREQTLLLIGVKLGFLAGVNRPTLSGDDVHEPPANHFMQLVNAAGPIVSNPKNWKFR